MATEPKQLRLAFGADGHAPMSITCSANCTDRGAGILRFR
jgi:hypothetical protein